MTIMKQKIYCNVHGWQEVIEDDTIPQTTCPINPTDSVIADSLYGEEINISRYFGLKGRALINNSSVAVIMFYDKKGRAVKLKDEPEFRITLEDTTDAYTLTWLKDADDKFEGFQLAFSVAQNQNFSWKVEK